MALTGASPYKRKGYAEKAFMDSLNAVFAEGVRALRGGDVFKTTSDAKESPKGTQ